MSINNNVGIEKNKDGVLVFGVYKVIKDKRVFVPKGEAVELRSIITNFETEERFYELAFFKDGKVERVVIPCEKLTKAGGTKPCQKWCRCHRKQRNSVVKLPTEPKV